MADDTRKGPEQEAWDRFGRVLGEVTSIASGIWDRNQKLLNSVSENVRGEKYTANQMADDAAKAMATAMDNLGDLWTSLTRVPELDEVATPLPTAFLFFPVKDDVKPAWGLAGPAWIRVPAKDLDNLPDEAMIKLSGEDPDGVAALDESLRATKVARRGYKVEASGTEGLEPGLYTGAVYLSGKQPRPLADLRVVVEEPPAAPPAAPERPGA